jgi:hypothetical protein
MEIPTRSLEKTGISEIVRTVIIFILFRVSYSKREVLSAVNVKNFCNTNHSTLQKKLHLNRINLYI